MANDGAKRPRRGGGTAHPVDVKVKAKIRKLGREGMGRNAIARECGVSPSTVSLICSQASPPITFDRTATKVALDAQMTDLKARRAVLTAGLLDDLDKIRGMLFADVERTHFSVTNGEEKYTSKPSSGEIKDLFIAAGIAIDKHLQLVKVDSDDRDLPAVEAWLQAMGVAAFVQGSGE